MLWLMLPLFLQAILMGFDEFYFHHQRGLPSWEKWGHPIDTFFVLICYLFMIFMGPSGPNIKIYIGLSAFSCLIITKDEFIHTQKCGAMENWIHSLLFILHPLTFFTMGLLWTNGAHLYILSMVAVVLFFFMLYQLLYWRLHENSEQRFL